MRDKKYNGFNNGKDASDGVGGQPPMDGYVTIKEKKTNTEPKLYLVGLGLMNINSQRRVSEPVDVYVSAINMAGAEQKALAKYTDPKYKATKVVYINEVGEPFIS